MGCDRIRDRRSAKEGQLNSRQFTIDSNGEETFAEEAIRGGNLRVYWA